MEERWSGGAAEEVLADIQPRGGDYLPGMKSFRLLFSLSHKLSNSYLTTGYFPLLSEYELSAISSSCRPFVSESIIKGLLL